MGARPPQCGRVPDVVAVGVRKARGIARRAASTSTAPRSFFGRTILGVGLHGWSIAHAVVGPFDAGHPGSGFGFHPDRSVSRHAADLEHPTSARAVSAHDAEYLGADRPLSPGLPPRWRARRDLMITPSEVIIQT
jgi:hypothetical protein